MNIDFRKEINGDTLLSRVVLNAMGDVKDETFGVILERYNARNHEHLEIVLTVEGVELPLAKVIEYYNTQLDAFVKREAKEMIDKRFEKTKDVLQSLEEQIQRLRDEVAKGLPKEEW